MDNDNIMTSTNFVRFNNTFFDLENNRLVNPIETKNFLILQAVDSQYFSKFKIETHKQLCDIELTCVLHESLACNCNSVDCTLQKGDVHICFKNEMHKLDANGGCRFQTLAFNIKQTSDFYPFLQKIRDAYDERNIDENIKLLEFTDEAIFEFYAYDRELSPLKLDCLLGQILISLLRAKSQPVKNFFTNDNLLLFAVNYIDKKFKDMFSAIELCEHIDYSYNFLFERFVAAFGITPKKYLTYKKMEYAGKQLLAGYSLKEIAETLKYSSPYNFSRAFKAFIGISPSEYKEKPIAIENPLSKIDR